MEIAAAHILLLDVERATERTRNALDSLAKDGGPDWDDGFYVDALDALREAGTDLTNAALALNGHIR